MFLYTFFLMKIGDVRRSGLRVIIPLGIDYYTVPVRFEHSQGPYNSQYPAVLLVKGRISEGIIHVEVKIQCFCIRFS